jgi:hypothetical protein
VIRPFVGAAMVAALLGVGCSSSSSSSSGHGRSADVPATTTTAAPYGRTIVRSGEQRANVFYTQGVAHMPGGWIFSGKDSLWRTDDAMNDVRHTLSAIPAAWLARGFDHLGDIDVVGRDLYAALEQGDFTKVQQAMARFDRDSLAFVDAVLVPQHENSFVSVDPATMIAYSMDHFDGDSVLRYDVAHAWKRLPPLRMNRVLVHTQGADVSHGSLWISTSDPNNDIFRVDLATGATSKVATMGHIGGEGEGIDATDLPSGLLHTVCVDASHVPVWFAHFRAGVA